MSSYTKNPTWQGSPSTATPITATALNHIEDGVAAHAHGVAELTATGTRDATTFLRGDNTWAVPAGGGGGASTVGFSAKDVPSSTVTVPSNTWTVVTGWSTELADTNAAFVPSTGIYTVPTSGTWIITGLITYTSVDDGAKIITMLYRNGAAYAALGRSVSGAVDSLGQGGAVILPLTAGDTLSLATFQSSAASKVISGAVGYNHFSAYRLGA